MPKDDSSRKSAKIGKVGKVAYGRGGAGEGSEEDDTEAILEALKNYGSKESTASGAVGSVHDASPNRSGKTVPDKLVEPNHPRTKPTKPVKTPKDLTVPVGEAQTELNPGSGAMGRYDKDRPPELSGHKEETLKPDETLRVDGTIHSAGGEYRLILQRDGNVVIYTRKDAAVWSTQTHGRGGNRLVMQLDGNLVLYVSKGVSLWSSRTAGNPGASATLHRDGSLTVGFDDGRILWSSRSQRVLAPHGGGLEQGQSLKPNGRLVSPDGSFRLVAWSDGRLELLSDDVLLWESGTFGHRTGRLEMQRDGNLVLYTAKGKPLWSSRTHGNPGSWVNLQDDANLVVYNATGHAIWSSETEAAGITIDGGDVVAKGTMSSRGIAAFGGRWDVRVKRDGTVVWSGEARNGGIDSYDYAVVVVIRAPTGAVLALTRSGSIPGKLPFADPTTRRWDETHHGVFLVRAEPWGAWRAGSVEAQVEYTSSITDIFETVVSLVIKAVVGTALSYAGAVAFIGAQVASLALSGSPVPGARIISDVLWLAGPSNTLYALAAAGMSSMWTKDREVSEEEYRWANEEVFNGTLPPRDRLRITDGLGGDDRPFVFPRFDKVYLINMGPDAYFDPRTYRIQDPDERKRKKLGETFIHELVHTCQLHYGNDLAFLGKALVDRLCEIGSDPYKYGEAGFRYEEQTLEVQANIVSHWFAGTSPGQPNVPKDPKSPYYRYITGNVWTRRYS